MLITLLSYRESLSFEDIVFMLLGYAVVIFVALPFHEMAHAFAADRLGDHTAKWNGRLTMNPLKHLDVLGTVMICLCGFGYAKPVPVNPYNFKHPKRDMALTALAGPLSNLLMAALSLAIFRVLYTFVDSIWFLNMAARVLISTFASINIGLARFESVEFAQRLFAQRIALGHRRDGLALGDDVMAGVALPAFLLAVDVDLLAAHGLRLAFQVVELAQVPRRDAEDLRERFERVALLGDDVVHAVGDIDVVSLVGVDRHAEIVGIDPLFVYGRQGIHAASGLEAFHGLLGARAVARCVERFALRAVEQVELRLLDDAAQPLRIVGRGGVTGRLQSARPAAVVVGGVDEERVVARLRIQKT